MRNVGKMWNNLHFCKKPISRDALLKLEETSLPPHEAFYSTLKDANITEEECKYCQQVWEENNMTAFKDFLVWYNNLDVVPFLEAVEKMSQFWQERNIDMFKDGISVPGLTLKYLFSFLEDQIYFSLFDQANSDLYHLIRDNNTGGPSIIFHRYHEADKTKIREAEKGQIADFPLTDFTNRLPIPQLLLAWSRLRAYPWEKIQRKTTEIHG